MFGVYVIVWIENEYDIYKECSMKFWWYKVVFKYVNVYISCIRNFIVVAELSEVVLK